MKWVLWTDESARARVYRALAGGRRSPEVSRADGPPGAVGAVAAAGWTRLAWGLGVALAYLLAAWLGLRLAVVGQSVTLVWPPSGIALVALLLGGRWMALGVAAGACAANALTGVPLPVAAGIACGNTLEALAGVQLLRWAGFHVALERPRDVLLLASLAALLAPVVAAAAGPVLLLWGGQIAPAEWRSAALSWWLGDMMGVLVVAPLLLVAFRHPPPAPGDWQGFELACLGTGLLLLCWAIFGSPELAGHGYYPAALAVFPFVVWGALRFGHWGACLVTVLVSVAAIWGTRQGSGPLAAATALESLLGWCIFANVVGLTGLLLAAIGAEQGRVHAALRLSRDELERRVLARTRELQYMNASLQQEAAERRRLEAELIRVSEAQQKAIGQELHDGLGQHLTSVAFFGATLQQRLALRRQPEAEAAGRIVDLVNKAIHMTRAMARGLYPAALESDGLPTALHQLAENTRSLRGMVCLFHVEPDVYIRDPLVAINLYRIAQEAVNNAVKHSKGSRLWIHLAREGEHYRLAISDDGQGVDPQQLARGRGLGMHNLRYRASLLGGQLVVERNAEGGTTVAVSYPVRSRERGRKQHEQQ